MGDPIEKEIFAPDIKKRRLPKPSLTAIAIIAALALGSVNLAFNVNANLHQQFPGNQAVSIIATYSFGGLPGQQVLSAGTTGNFTLSVFYAGTQPTSLILTFNATNPESWTVTCTNASGCVQTYNADLQMIVQGSVPFGPINASHINNAFANSVTVPVVHGANTYNGQIKVSPSAVLSSFILNWFASQ
jgi:hypothetical protein